MKYIKNFEKLDKEYDDHTFNPREGDYVIVNPEPGFSMPYVIDKIGKVLPDERYGLKSNRHFKAMYGDSEIKFIWKRWIVFCSPNKDDAEAYLQAKKYNL